MDANTIMTWVITVAIPSVCAGGWAVICWIAPRVDALYKDSRALLEKLQTQHLILERYSAVSSILSEIVAAQQEVITKGRWLTLIVDDSSVSRRLMWALCESLASDFKLTVADVDSLAEAYKRLAYSRLILLDVFMHDCDSVRAAAFIIAAQPCPVIVITGDDSLELKDFPKAAGLLHKADTLVTMQSTVRAVLANERTPDKAKL